MTLPKPPETMSRKQRAAFRRIAGSLDERGIDPATRQELLADYVILEGRIATLRGTEAEGGMAATRALNVATAERRRLHAALFAGARKVEMQPPASPALSSELDAQTAADAAWRQFYFGGQSGLDEARLRAEHGPPGWNALCYRSLAEQLEAERVIARNTRHGNAAERRA
jgi:hypothetical protein